MKEFLDSDRLNFLVWRYLLEGNYRETAAKFQKEWRVKEPHRQFDFAPHVQNHALVSIVNRGLVYCALEREFAESQVPQNASGEPREAPHGVFGPLIVQPPAPLKVQKTTTSAPDAAAEAGGTAKAPPVAANANVADNTDADADADADADGDADLDAEGDVDPDADATGEEDDILPTVEGENNRKRQLQAANGSPMKRARLGNGYENGLETGPTPMEIDEADSGNNNHAYPSPLEVDQIATPPPRTFGPEQGTQVDKVDELTPETIFLSTSPEDASTNAGSGAVPPATPPTENTPSRSQPNPILLHCEWSPIDPSVLAAAGTDALARIWTVSRPTQSGLAPGHVADHVSSVFGNLTEDDAAPDAVITAMAWNWDGSALALATDSGNKARISIWAADGTHLQRFDVAEPPIIKLKWHPNNTCVLAVAPDTEGTLVTVFETQVSHTVSYSLPSHDLDANPLDAAWISDTEFLLCGGRLLESFKYTETEITPARKFPTRESDIFTQAQFDWRSKLVATASETGVIDLWDESGQRRSIPAHSGPITSLSWQPLQGNPLDEERLLASGGEDGIISVWNARVPENKPKWSMTMEPPIVALSFTPDGAFIAGATTDRILIWKVGEYSIPRASWSRTSHPGWSNSKPVNGSPASIEDTHCLCWDASGQKLAYGTNSLIAVINFR
ncbi:hypothetical protein MCOR25_009126 [Pyricularia grisea]|uniref:LisH domain-containing protein n=1 Tax=Pyricularia grisea TaxID=148305 RepID=A0A6P8ARI4_PYRGI|nr:uncharacterized protein PgNI_09748 [Pyricularia grisea]KAI6353175.1 hypothetical protein MCOR25_009126 [Pyricularia grisea]TLD04707.1 hypothetical protein PgNI_09748 [Pyricularia grisea]